MLHAHSLTVAQSIAPVLIAGAFIALCSLLREPARQQLSALMIAGAGAAYLSGGFGIWEFVFCSGFVFLAYGGLRDYWYIAVAWLLHSAWDVAHHFYGHPIVPFSPTSSAGCAICDAVLALWYFRGAPAVLPWSRKERGRPVEANLL